MDRYKLYIAAIVVMMLAACADSTKEEPVVKQPEPTPVVEQTQEEVPIDFNASVAEHAVTRDATTIVYGENEDTDYQGYSSISQLYGAKGISGKGFGVYSIYTGSKRYFGEGDNKPSTIYERQVVMNNQQVYSTNGTSWTYSPIRIWPGNASYITFFAYAPWTSPSGVKFTDDDSAYFKTYAYDNTDEDTTNDDESLNGVSYIGGNEVLKAPYFHWEQSDQKDLLWGMSNQDVSDVNGNSLKQAGEDFVDMHRPSDGTLHWNFKHALARVKFSVSNYLAITEAYNSLVGGVNATQVLEYNGGVGDSKNGYYAFLSNENVCYKFKESESERKLVITGVKIKNLHTAGDLYFFNETQYEPNWNITETNTEGYDLKPLNAAIYYSGDVAGIDEDSFNSIPDLPQRDLADETEKPIPLTKSTADDSYDHYVLIMPKENTGTGSTPIEITISYYLITKVVLEGKYVWDYTEEANSPQVSDSTERQVFISGNQLADKEDLTGKFDMMDFEANHSYHINIMLGNLMSFLYEVTDWDNVNEIDLPDFY